MNINDLIEYNLKTSNPIKPDETPLESPEKIIGNIMKNNKDISDLLIKMKNILN